ncbi:MAG: response regulator [Nitrospiraceae bacterium]|nr:response regulator [Nitrospiraceae bacterium]
MKNILIVDDNKDILAVLAADLNRCLKGCMIMTAQSGREGADILSRVPVDLVVTDLDMPTMNGYQFIKEARIRRPEVSVCVMTGLDCREAAEQLLPLGPSRMIEKPFHVERLATVIREELGMPENPSDQDMAGPVGCKDAPC